MMVAVYRMVVQGWPRDKAIRQMKEMSGHAVFLFFLKGRRQI